MSMPNRSAIDVGAAGRKLLAYCRASGWAGWDPYDALNSRLLQAAPLLDSRWPRLAITQLLKRSPVNVRPLLRVPPTRNAKGIALCLAALLKAPELMDGGSAETVDLLARMLEELRSPGAQRWCWGYSFPWQTRTILVPRGAPNLVCTAFAARALLDLYEQRRETRFLEMAASAADYILDELYWTGQGETAGFGYPLPSSRTQIHNANFLGAALFCRIYRLTGERRFVAPALKAARYSAKRQEASGAWMYGEAATQQWVDNFHTGYNLCALQEISRDLRTDEFAGAIRRGYEFYKTHFFREDGAARYFHDGTYPLDVHCFAQSVITLLAFRETDSGASTLARRVFRWAMENMWSEQGYFHYRVLRFVKIRTSYMRWSQAWMLLAAAALLAETRETAGEPTLQCGARASQ